MFLVSGPGRNVIKVGFAKSAKSVSSPTILCQFPQLELARDSHPLLLLMELPRSFAIGISFQEDIHADSVRVWADEKMRQGLGYIS